MLAFILWSLYCMIASVAIAMTLREYLRSRRKHLHWAMLGLASCLVWPLVVVVAAISARREGRAL